MTIRSLLALAALAALAAPAQAQMSGGWQGVGLQAGPSGVQSTWTISMTVRSDIASRIEYPSLGCTGTLHELSRSRDEIEFREEITAGPCIDGGRIVARLRDGRLSWFWYIPGGNAGVDASAVLYRESPIS
jgi:hypothetical protein